jgi:hypothetical protein
MNEKGWRDKGDTERAGQVREDIDRSAKEIQSERGTIAKQLERLLRSQDVV